MRTIRYVVCDVFTDRPLAGNQLAVFTDARGLEPDLMQALACEMGFSESTFVLPAAAGGHARVRIFTPKVEVPFAGHPTLGTAFVVGESTQLREVVLETGAGLVPVRLEREGARVVFGWMTQPTPRIVPFAHEAELTAALGVTASVLPIACYDNGIAHVYVTLPSRDAVAALRPDLARLAALTMGGVNVFAGDGDRWKTRMFAPGSGVAEDPATGSAAGPLAWHLARHGRVPYGQTIRIEQGAEIGRPSVLYARAGNTGDTPVIEVGGSAVTVARGEFRLHR
ncbi:MAG TPA: PhzF family phenazine biosynthesis protein [Candidatus Binatia bacterium]|nr:PhzF family phenazine biosynthesis protein [Candidatus Binatia bacterium]